MENGSDNNGFQYTYSAKQQEEIRRIREKYVSDEENKMERIRRLDSGVTQKATAVSLIFGISGALILGFGMSLAMTELSEILGSHANYATVIGAVIGIVGGIIASLAYPMYNLVSNREREKIAPEVLRLTDELLK